MSGRLDQMTFIPIRRTRQNSCCFDISSVVETSDGESNHIICCAHETTNDRMMHIVALQQ